MHIRYLKIASIFLVICMILSACAPITTSVTSKSSKTASSISPEDIKSYDDPNLCNYVEAEVYRGLKNEYESDTVTITGIAATEYSKEYIEELNYNSQENIYFGYRLSELEKQFSDEKFYFTLGDNGQTVALPLKDTTADFNQIAKNVAIGAGVILICVTASVVCPALGVSEVGMVFAASAKTATEFALSGSVISAAFTAYTNYLQTGNVDLLNKEVLMNSSKGFKWGALSGVLAGGSTALFKMVGSPEVPIIKWTEAEERALKKYGGQKQVSFLNGEKISSNVLGSTRPDIIRDRLFYKEAIEVKRYETIGTNKGMNSIISTLKPQLENRAKQLPPGYRQRLVLDVKGLGLSKKAISNILKKLREEFKYIPHFKVDALY